MEYEPQLREGEVHTHSADGVLTVRVGMETRGQFLARQWPAYVAIGMMLSAIGMNLYLRWIYGRLRPVPIHRDFFYYMLWFWMIWTIAGLISGIVRRRGTVVLVASRRGLIYRNIPSFKSEGEVAREEIHGLPVVLYRVGLRRRTYQLLLRGEMSANRILAFGKDQKELERVRDMIAEALGVKEQVAAPAPG